VASSGNKRSNTVSKKTELGYGDELYVIKPHKYEMDLRRNM
jgi:hypothetical protein